MVTLMRALTIWGRARYLLVTEAPHNTESEQFEALYMHKQGILNPVTPESTTKPNVPSRLAISVKKVYVDGEMGNKTWNRPFGVKMC